MIYVVFSALRNSSFCENFCENSTFFSESKRYIFFKYSVSSPERIGVLLSGENLKNETFFAVHRIFGNFSQ